MPNRILRDWTDSDRVNSLSAEAERLFIRLIMKADDYGRYFADTKRIKSFLFPLKEGLRETDISRWLAECESAGLLRFYQATGKRFLELFNFDQRLRNMRKIHPPPLDAAADGGNSPQVAADGRDSPQVAATCGLNTNTNTKPNPISIANPKRIRNESESDSESDTEGIPGSAHPGNAPKSSPNASPARFGKENGDRPDWNGQTPREKLLAILGNSELANRPDWLTRLEKRPKRIEAIMDAMHSDLATGRIIKNRGAYAETLWKIAR